MNIAFRLVEHRPADPSVDNPRAVLYTVHLDGHPQSETDAFFNDSAVRAFPTADSVRVRYEQLHNHFGLYEPHVWGHAEAWFKDEGGGCYALQGKLTPGAKRLLPPPRRRLRLYAFCLDRPALQDCPGLIDGLYPGEIGYPIAVFGGGGIKTKRDPRDCPNVRAHFDTIHHVRDRLLERLAEGSVDIVDDGLTLDGDLDFPARP